MKRLLRIVAYVLGGFVAVVAATFIAAVVFFTWPVVFHGDFVNRTERVVEEVVLSTREPIGRLEDLAPAEQRLFRFKARAEATSLKVAARLQGGEILSLDCNVYIDGFDHSLAFTIELVEQDGPMLTCVHEGRRVTSAPSEGTR